MARDRRVEHLSCGLEPQAQPIYQSRIVRTLEIAVDEKMLRRDFKPTGRSGKASSMAALQAQHLPIEE